MNVRQRRGIVAGLLFIILGVVFLLEALDVFEMAPATLWPLLFISLGLSVLAGAGGSDENGSPGI